MVHSTLFGNGIPAGELTPFCSIFHRAARYLAADWLIERQCEAGLLA